MYRLTGSPYYQGAPYLLMEYECHTPYTITENEWILATEFPLESQHDNQGFQRLGNHRGAIRLST